MKRAADEPISEDRPAKKLDTNGSATAVENRFRENLFSGLDKQREQYDESKPYKHGVISDLLQSDLLRSVRYEIREHISFTTKETDIYRIDQSGDLANLDGLNDDALQRLPSLKSLRDALYSLKFREYLSNVTGSGPLSGSKTDMAINVYTPGCHLLCHDDVIGSRRVSYIVYLTDPDVPWKAEWGGALRLYPTQTFESEDKTTVKVPSPDFSISIPPAFNQLSFFAVQPGESYHDVEEVYASSGDQEPSGNDQRVRMAISGWYHIPQEGESGYEEGREEELAKESSLTQLLQGKAGEYDLPAVAAVPYPASENNTQQPTQESDDTVEDQLSLSEADLDFLLQYISPNLLVPDTLASVSEIFSEECSMLLENFLSPKFAEKIKKHIEIQEKTETPRSTEEIQKTTGWTVARPPHKHRYLFQQANEVSERKDGPIQELLSTLIPSVPFRKWLEITTDQKVLTHHSLARRFRRGYDYALAQTYDKETPGLEFCLSLTPTSGWGGNQEDLAAEIDVNGKDDAEEKAQTDKEKGENAAESSGPEVGGYLAYLAGDQDDDDEDEEEDEKDQSGKATREADGEDAAASKVSASISTSTGALNPTKARSSRPKKPKNDPAVYQTHRPDPENASGADGDAGVPDEEDDPLLFHMPATWNQLGLVLRDRGTMRFVKYVSRSAKGDRWDMIGDFEVEEYEDDEEEGEGAQDKMRERERLAVEEASTERQSEDTDYGPEANESETESESD